MKSKQKKAAKKAAKPRTRAAAPKKAVSNQVPAPVAKAQVFPVVALVAKSGDKIPVTVTNQAHLDRLIDEHGAGAVQVQS